MQLGLAESARVTTADESRFRIDYPNSKPRRSCIIALDVASDGLLRRIAEAQARPGARFLRYVEAKVGSRSLPMLPVGGLLEHLDGTRVNLLGEIEKADIVVMLTVAGATAESAELIGNACSVAGKMTTGFILHSAEAGAEALTRTLIAFRPFAAMLVVSSGEEYVTEMLNALRV